MHATENKVIETMDKYVRELLDLKNSVVLPEIGGLLKIGKNITINAYLKFNDGKLILSYETENGELKTKEYKYSGEQNIIWDK